MIITDYIKLQQYTTEPQQAFLGRRQPAHGSPRAPSSTTRSPAIAGRISAASCRRSTSWALLRAGRTSCRVADIGEAPGRLQKLTMEEIAAVALQPSALRFAEGGI